MNTLDDVIVAVSSASVGFGQTARSIVRLSGTGLWRVLEGLIVPIPSPEPNTVSPCRLHIAKDILIDAVLYSFCGPHSYTGEDMAELHLWAAPDVVELLLKKLSQRARLAGPGEFTLRAYLNGKMDLTQAEAVAQIVSSANTLQLVAAQKLLHGKFAETIDAVRAKIFELLSLIEAKLDFSEEDIEFILAAEAAAQITAQAERLQGLLDGSIRCERIIDLDTVGLAGLPNAGKSSLLNALLGTARSIVSPIEASTRDVLTGILELDGLSCVLFDCAGLKPHPLARDSIEQQADLAAVDALRQAAIALFCIDAQKSSWEVEVQILAQVQAKTIIPVITKADLADAAQIERLSAQWMPHFENPPSITSACTGQGLGELKSRIEKKLLSGRPGTAQTDRLTLNQRHHDRIDEAVKTLRQAADEITAQREEVASMLLRQAYETLGGLEREDTSQKILDSIFSQFCIGK